MMSLLQQMDPGLLRTAARCAASGERRCKSRSHVPDAVRREVRLRRAGTTAP